MTDLNDERLVAVMEKLEAGKAKESSWAESLWLKIAAGLVVAVVSTVGAVVLERMGSLQTELGQMSAAIGRVDEIDEIQERLLRMELSKVQTPHVQLSSAVDMFPGIDGQVVEMELVDSLHDVSFDPKRSASQIQIELDGDYFLIAAPQVQRVEGETGAACFDMWLRVNGSDLRNSGVRECWSEDTQWKRTSVLVLQAMVTLRAGDVLEVVVRSDPPGRSGMVAIRPGGTPLVPSIIFSMLKVST